MNRYQSAEYENCVNGCGCRNGAAVAAAGDSCPRCDTCAEAAVNTGTGNGGNSCGCAVTATAANNGNGNTCRCCSETCVRDLDENACVCAVIAKINELLAVLRDTGVIDDCD